MHSEVTTDLSMIKSNLISKKSDRENVVLIKTGALNPIHRSHISNLTETKEYLEKFDDLNVIGGYLSPTHHQYVYDKLGEECLPAHLRIEMCQKAIEEENQQHWLSVDKAECMAPHFISLTQVTLSLQTFLNEHFKLDKPIRVIYVAGLDLFNRCHGMHSLRRSHMGGVAVVYRAGENPSLIQSIIEENPSKIDFVSLNSDQKKQLTSISSTSIRQRLRTDEDCSHLTYHSVLQCLHLAKTNK